MDHMLQLTDHWVGYLSLTIFVIAYMVVMVEEFTHLRKSKPVILAAGIIWALIAFQYEKFGLSEIVVDSIKHSLIEYAELFLFLFPNLIFTFICHNQAPATPIDLPAFFLIYSSDYLIPLDL